MYRRTHAGLPQFDSLAPDPEFDQSPQFEGSNDFWVGDAIASDNTALVNKSSALGRPARMVQAIADEQMEPVHYEPAASLLRSASQFDIAGVLPASRLVHPPVPLVSSGNANVDVLTGGLPRGCLTEVFGSASSGRTSLMLAAMAESTRRGELCALVDAGDSFDPHSAAAAGMDLDRLLWIRCSTPRTSEYVSSETSGHEIAATGSEGFDPHRITELRGVLPPAKVWYGRPPARSERKAGDTKARAESMSHDDSVANARKKVPATKGIMKKTSRQEDKFKLKSWARTVDQALKASDLLLQSGGFGLVVLDFGDVPAALVRRIPLASWFRFRRAVENTPAVLLTITQESAANTCASLVLQLQMSNIACGHASAGHETADGGNNVESSSVPAHARILRGAATSIEVVRSRVEPPPMMKKSPRPVRTVFDTRTEWAG